MKKLVVSLLISLLGTTACFSQTTSTDSVYVMTAEELKYVNMIFAEHEHLSNENKLLVDEIYTLNEMNDRCEQESIVKDQQLGDYEKDIKRLKKQIKVKNTLITGTGVGFLVSLLLLICGK